MPEDDVFGRALDHGRIDKSGGRLHPLPEATMKPRPSESEFDELKRKRDEGLRAIVEATCKEMGWNPAKTGFHCSSMSGCYCACPDGPCQHVWGGPEWTSDDGCGSSATCSRCGEVAMFHDMRCAP